MSATQSAFLAAVDEINGERPSYRLGGKATDGTCDCIGLIIGALLRCGVKWPGIHGSNWAARNAMVSIGPVDEAHLRPGCLVYKRRGPTDTGYSLPDRYAGSADRDDYYHVGVVRSVEPLQIVHCTTPGGMTTDTKIGKWARCGWCKMIDEENSDMEKEESEMSYAIVTAETGNTVNLRKSPDGALLTRVPVGSTVEVIQRESSGWSKIRWNGTDGWMDARYLRDAGSEAEAPDSEEDGTVSVTLSRDAAEALMEALGDVLGRG